MPWLVREAQVLATIDSPRGTGTAPTQKDADEPVEGTAADVRLLRRPVLVHTMRPGTALDVAWCQPEPGAVLVVQRVIALKGWRLARPRLRAPAVVVAPAGAFERWHLQVGDRLEVKGG